AFEIGVEGRVLVGIEMEELRRHLLLVDPHDDGAALDDDLGIGLVEDVEGEVEGGADLAVAAIGADEKARGGGIPHFVATAVDQTPAFLRPDPRVEAPIRALALRLTHRRLPYPAIAHHIALRFTNALSLSLSA